MSIKTTTKIIERGIRSKGALSRSQDSELDSVNAVKNQLTSFVKNSEGEKKDLNRLNDRLAVYVDRVKALEAENFKLLKEIQDIQSKWGDGSRLVKQQFDKDLYDLRTRVDDTANLKTIADVKLKRAQSDINDLQQRNEDLARLRDLDKQKLLKLEHELEHTNLTLSSLAKTTDDNHEDLEKYRVQRDNLWNKMNDLLDQLDDEVLKRVSVEYTNQTLKEHIDFINQVHERQVNEMNQLTDALPFNDQIEFYKDELKRVITNIRRDYEQLSQDQAHEIQEWMRVKTEELVNKYNARDPAHDLELELQQENVEQLRSTYSETTKEMEELKRKNEALQKRLLAIEDHVENEKRKIAETLEDKSNEINLLSDNLNGLLNDYNHLNANKASLEYEINVYKRLLDSQLNRFGLNEAKQDAQQASVSSGAFGGKVQNKKEKKGAIGISDAAPDGKFISIENSGASNNLIVDLSGWELRRRVDNNAEVVYKFPSGILLAPNHAFKIWGRAYGQNRSGQDLINGDLDNWGIGMKSISRLLNFSSEEKSTFSQQITFGSY